jgi:hypothetical protein
MAGGTNSPNLVGPLERDSDCEPFYESESFITCLFYSVDDSFRKTQIHVNEVHNLTSSLATIGPATV